MEIRTWDDTIAAQLRARLGYPEAERRWLRSEAEVRADLGAQSVEATEKRVAAEMSADVAALHRGVPMIVLPDCRSDLEKITEAQQAIAKSTIRTYTHAEIEAMAQEQYARGPVTGVIRPGEARSGVPGRETGIPWRAIAFGPDTEQAAMDTMARWQAEGLAQEMGERDLLRKMGIF